MTILTKRFFDHAVTLLAAPLWLPVLALVAALNWLCNGAPVCYRSMRRVHGKKSIRVVKFRTMVRNAEQILNRETVPITDTCFLNIPSDSEAYTNVGRKIERFALTELPQLFHVLSGQMSLVGNRPLPENVIAALRENFPFTEDRFMTKAGLTGPVQLIGRHKISDLDRLALEIDYCMLSSVNYSAKLDFLILLNTVIVALGLRPAFSIAEVRALMAACTPVRGVSAEKNVARRFLRFQTRAQNSATLYCNRERFKVRSIGYEGATVIGAHALAVGQTLSLTPDGSFAAAISGKVVWCEALGAQASSYAAGICFEPRRTLGGWIVGVLSPTRRSTDWATGRAA